MPSDPTLTAVLASTVGLLFEPTLVLGVLAATVTVVVLLTGLAIERRDLAGLGLDAARPPKGEPARIGIPLHAHPGRSGA